MKGVIILLLLMAIVQAVIPPWRGDEAGVGMAMWVGLVVAVVLVVWFT